MVYQQVAPSLVPKLILPRVGKHVLAAQQEVSVSKPKPVKKSKSSVKAPVKRAVKKTPRPRRYERMNYRIRPVKGVYSGNGKKLYTCACGCGQKVSKLFAKGHVSKLVKILTDDSLDKAIAILKEVRSRIVPEKRKKR